MRDAEKLIGQNTRDQLLKIYTEKFKANLDFFNEQEKTEIRRYLESGSGMLAGVVVEAKGLQVERQPETVMLNWYENGDRTESEGILRYRNRTARYRVRHTEDGNHEVRLAELEMVVAKFNTSTLAKDYCQARANYMLRGL